MSTPVDQLQPPPIDVIQQSAYTAHTGYGSVGPVIAVLAVITILGVIAVMIGRLCSGRRILGHGGEFDFESWLERKCSTCIDGRVDPTPSRNRTMASDASSGAAAAAEDSAVEETQQEIKEESQETKHEQGQEQEQEQEQPRKNSHVHGTTSTSQS